jgi:CxxC motif-containing protein
MERNLTCIVCPLGCSLKVELDGKNVVSVSGNTCKRGEVYAHNECTNPQRTVTTTVKCSDGSVIPVKTDTTIPKEKMEECVKIINTTVADLPISVGDVIIKDVFGANIVATANRK